MYNFVVKNVLFANMYIQYSLTKYGFWSTSEAPPPPPSKIIKKNEDLFIYNFVVKNVICQYLYIQYSPKNMDFGVI